MRPGPWTEQAACRGEVETMALPDLGRDDGRSGGASYTTHQRRRIAVARSICARCPVLDDCTAWVLGHPDPAIGMVAGGMTPAQRSDVRFGRRVRRV